MGDIAELNSKDYGQWLRHKRICLGLSRQRLSDVAGVSVISLSRYEHNLAIPNDFGRAKLENAFNEVEEHQRNNRLKD